MRLIRANTPNAAYQKMLRALINTPDHGVSPRGLPCVEICNVMTEIWNPSHEPIVTANVERNERIARYTRAEFALYESGTNRTIDFAAHAKFWESIGEPDGTVNSAYGKIIWHDRLPCNLTPWDWAREALTNDPQTRQAVLLFLRPDHLKPTKDLVCTCHGMFLIREDLLHLTVVMRSNDVVKGSVYDLAWFQWLLRKMSDETKYPMGVYTHFTHSLHLYRSDLDLARSMIHDDAGRNAT